MPHGIDGKARCQIVRIEHISLGFAHFIRAEEEPGVAEELFRQRLAERHEKDGPIDGMEAHDILADDMAIRRPVFCIGCAGGVNIEAERRCIIKQRVDPHIDDVLLVKRHGNAPGKGGTGNAKILQSRFKEVIHHLLAAALRRDPVGVFLNIAQQAILMGAHTEEIGFFFCFLQRSAAIGAAAAVVMRLRFGEEGFARHAIPALISILINIALLVKTGENALHRGDMIRIRCADETGIGDPHEIPNAFDLARNAVDIFLGADARLFGAAFDFLAVLVRAGQKEDVISALALIPRDGIGCDGFIGVADVRLAGAVCDCRCNIKCFFFIHGRRVSFLP